MILSRSQRGVLALLAGCVVNYAGDRLLGVRIEYYWGLATFNLPWFLDVFVLPFVVGTVVGMIFGLGGKWLCYFPPLIVRTLSYVEVVSLASIPAGASVIPLGWWGFFVILTMEAAAFGGVAGEIWVKRTYGRLPPELVYKRRSASDERRARSR